MRPRALSLTLAFLALAPLACEPPPPPPKAPHVEPAAPPPPAPPVLAARWFTTGAPTMIGPTTQAGTLVLLGGRRALVAPDGTVKTETTPSPEGLLDVIEVPTEHGSVLVARAEHAIYRLDYPLGEPVVIARSTAIGHIASGPGVVLAWGVHRDVPIALDVTNGAERPMTSLPPLAIRAAAFLDTKRGAMIFEGAGLALTTDGGATWKLAADTNKGDAARMSGLRRLDSTLRAFAFPEGPDAPIDFTKLALGALEQPVAPEKEAPLLRWVRATGRDPLEALATGGVDSPDGAIIASHGLAARVDPKTGVVTDVLQFAKGQYMSPCSVVSAGATAWIGCALSETAVPDMFDPWGVVAIASANGALKVDKPALIRNGEAELRASPSGGVLVMSACTNEEEGDACVRQPSGSWKTVRVATSPGIEVRTLGALADGRVAALRAPVDVPAGSKPRWSIVVFDEDRATPFGDLDLDLEPSAVAFEAGIEETADHALRITAATNDAGLVFLVKPKSDPATAVRVPDATALRVHGVHGVAAGNGKLAVSLDGGASWSPAAPPKTDGGLFTEGGVEVSDLGVRVAEWARLGWGPEEAERPAAPEQGGAAIAFPATKEPPEPPIRCDGAGTTQGTPILIGSAQIPLALGDAKTPPKGTKRDGSSWASSASGMLGTVARLEEEGKDAPDAKPEKWTIRYLNGAAVGDKPRSWSGAAPKEGGYRSDLLVAHADGPRAFFGVRSNRKVFVVRVKGGAATIAELPVELAQGFEGVMLGADKSETIAWWSGSSLVAWSQGEQPKAIGKVVGRSMRVLGEPSKDGVPVVLAGPDWTATRTFPLAGTLETHLDGWTKIGSFLRDAASLPACGPKAKGTRFVVARGRGNPTIVDGVNEASVRVELDLRVAPEGACVASEASLVRPDRNPMVKSDKGEDKAKKDKKKDTGPVAFLRIDWLGKKAEGGDQGAPPATLRRLTCARGDSK